MSLSTFHKLRKLGFIIFTVGGASAISLIGGLGLEAVHEQILPIIPLLIALPALNTMVGDYAATIAAHAGDPAERSTTKRTLLKAISKVIWINIAGVIALSLVLAARRGYALEQIFLIKFVCFVIIAMLSVIAVMFLITIVLDKLLEKNHLNPDDVLIPVVTTISDIFMLGLIALATIALF
jgi:cation transporter-like permease